MAATRDPVLSMAKQSAILLCAGVTAPAVRVMKVLAVNGSPRKNGNTSLMIKEIVKLAEARGAQSTYYDLVDLKVADCKACMKCRSGEGCSQHDDAEKVIEGIKEADVVILGSPVFMGDETGMLKCLADRMYCLLGPAEGSGGFQARIEPGKKFILVLTCGLADGDKVYNYISTRYFKLFIKQLEFSDIRTFIIGGANPGMDARALPKAKEALQAAGEFLTPPPPMEEE